MKWSSSILLSALFGVMVGLGIFTFRFAEGFSYFTNDPNACANCHIMRDYLDSWQKSSHHSRAVCNDCHTPHAILPKLWTKTENGWRHSTKFTLQTFREPLRITPTNARRLQANCIGCHEELVSELRDLHGGTPDQDLNCVRCHAGVGHGPRR
jgi:cytochrome c nitrite reductase small subunit